MYNVIHFLTKVTNFLPCVAYDIVCSPKEQHLVLYGLFSILRHAIVHYCLYLLINLTRFYYSFNTYLMRFYK